MSRLIVLYNYNKYYNRIIKRKSSFQDYLNLITPQGNTPAAYRGFIREKMNFDYQDGVYAQHIINFKKSELSLSLDHPDYCVLEESWTTGEGEQAVTETRITRYFILDVTKVRGYQYQLSLRRDLLADFYNEVLNAPVYIEKGNVQSIDDPAIFNKESLTFNQIKRDELLLNQHKFSGKGKGWVVGYIAKDQQGTAITGCEAISEPPASSINYDDLPSIIKNCLTNNTVFYEMSRRERTFSFAAASYINSKAYRCALGFNISGNIRYCDISRNDGYYSGALIKLDNIVEYASNLADYKQKMEIAFGNQETEDIPDEMDEFFEAAHGSAYCNYSESLVSSYNGKYVLKDGELYELVIEDDDEHGGDILLSYSASQVNARYDALASKARDYLNYLIAESGISANSPTTVSSYAAGFSEFAPGYKPKLVRATFDVTKCDIPANRNENFDAPYDIFCIPLGEMPVKNGTSVVLTTYSNVALPMARGIAIKGTTDKIYDIQILPYCPYSEIIDSDGNVQISGMTEHKDYEYIYKESGGQDVAIGVIIFPKTCRGTFDITIPTNNTFYNNYLRNVIDLGTSGNTILEKKVRSETHLLRFVSPNFASSFEINAQKNNGIQTLNVDYFYKPYSPYIHIAPYFDGLYGQDFNDPKGLICSGDFSISTAASQWEKYQIENKNYENIFNRQIENLDINNSIAYEKAGKTAGIGLITSTLGGLGAGAAAGGIAGSVIPGLGTAIGAAVGGAVGAGAAFIASAFGAKYDMEYLKKSQSEARSYAVDMYAYSLGNVEALPYTLTRVSAFTPNNKIFPFIEAYTCTEEEKEALINKIVYNGMTIMRIGKIQDFIGLNDPVTNKELKYVSGQLIRLVGVDEDSHVIAEIAQEIKEGAYYYGDSE